MDTNENKYDKPQGSGASKVLILVLLLITGFAGYLFYKNSKQKVELVSKDEVIQTHEDTIANKVKQIEQLREAYIIIRKEREDLGLSNASLNKQIEKLNDVIGEAKKGNYKNLDVAQLNKTISKAKSDIKNRDNEIANLEDSLKLYVRKIRDYESKSNSGNNNDNNNTNSTAQANTDTNVVAVHKEHLRELEEKVKLAGGLRAQEIQISVLNKKGKEAFKDEYNLKNVNKLKVAFILADNKIAKPGNRDILLRVLEPNGSPITTGNYKTDDKEVPYTVKKTVSYHNKNQLVTFLFENNKPYAPGSHTVEICEGGNVIGKSKVVLW